MSSTVNFPLPSRGIDILSEETALGQGAVREARNIDIARDGSFARRTGTIEHPLSKKGMHSMHYSKQRGYLLVVCKGVLYRVQANSLEEIDQLNSDHPVDYTEHDGNLYYVNRTSSGYIPSDSRMPEPVGLRKPDHPVIAAAEGALEPGGNYAVCITLVSRRGEESPASDVQIININTGGIRLSGLPVFDADSGISVRVYITPKDGDILYRVSEFPAIFSTYIVTSVPKGAICTSQGLQPLPYGDFVRWFNSRLYVARDNNLFFSEPMRPRLYNPAHNVVQFSGYISFIEPVIDGIYVGDSRGIWFLAGTDPENFQLNQVSKVRAVTRSSVSVPPEHFNGEVVRSQVPVAVWLSASGHMVGLPGGNIVELNSDRFKTNPFLYGRSTFLFRNGVRQVVTLVDSTNPTAKNAAVNSTI